MFLIAAAWLEWLPTFVARPVHHENLKTQKQKQNGL